LARITVEDCLENVANRFELVYLTIERVKQLRKNVPPLVLCKNKEIVTALREIAAKKVTYENIKELEKDYEEKKSYQMEKGEL
jgi:DNA-directed RNA polymerase subunit omega